MTEKEVKKIFEEYKRAYKLLGLDEDVDYDSQKLKKIYRLIIKRIHPDDINTGDAEKFKEVTDAYDLLKDEVNRILFKKLKERFEPKSNKSEGTKSNNEKGKDDTNSVNQEIKETTNKYIFQRRDGSKIELQPLEKLNIDGQTIICYKLSQYYKDITYINNIYAKINLQELMTNPQYCDFCVNSFLSKDRVENSCKGYNRYLGYVERAKGFLYRSSSYDADDVFDTYIDIGKINTEKEDYIYIDPEKDFDKIKEEDIDLDIEKTGKVIINGKEVNQYNIYSAYIDLNTLVYGDIDIKRLKKDSKYKRLVCKKFLTQKRLKEKTETDGYIGSFVYNPVDEDYNIIIDNEIREVLQKRNLNKVK